MARLVMEKNKAEEEALWRVPTKVEAEHVHQVYNAIATHFSETRYKPWPLVEKFMLEQEEGSVVADVGCGNGKYMGVNPRCFALGSDWSSELISICKERGFEAMIADNMNLPYRSAAFDAVISIAVIHHLSSRERRLHTMQELHRILKVGGRMLITAWAFEQVCPCVLLSVFVLLYSLFLS
ncbi:tRNA methyltransferase, has a role in tRNA modification [Balamuthia mandrillaris]